MSQQEFEPREQQSSGKKNRSRRQPDQREEGMPRDELPGAYDAPASQAGHAAYQDYQPGQTHVPWWARAQPQQGSSLGFVAIVAVVILILLLTGVLGVVGIVLGSLAHVLGVILGAIFALLIFVFLLVFLILVLVWRAIGRATRSNRRARR